MFTTLDAVERSAVQVDRMHRDHVIVEQVHSDLKASAMAHVPSGAFNANAAWLVLATIAFNLTRAAATLTGDNRLARATTPTIRARLINVPARLASSSARRLSPRLPDQWPWAKAGQHFFDQAFGRDLTPARAT